MRELLAGKTWRSRFAMRTPLRYQLEVPAAEDFEIDEREHIDQSQAAALRELEKIDTSNAGCGMIKGEDDNELAG